VNHQNAGHKSSVPMVSCLEETLPYGRGSDRSRNRGTLWAGSGFRTTP
jgi:hypothetical protein